MRRCLRVSQQHASARAHLEDDHFAIIPVSTEGALGTETGVAVDLDPLTQDVLKVSSQLFSSRLSGLVESVVAHVVSVVGMMILPFPRWLRFSRKAFFG